MSQLLIDVQLVLVRRAGYLRSVLFQGSESNGSERRRGCQAARAVAIWCLTRRE